MGLTLSSFLMIYSSIMFLFLASMLMSLMYLLYEILIWLLMYSGSYSFGLVWSWYWIVELVGIFYMFFNKMSQKYDQGLTFSL